MKQYGILGKGSGKLGSSVFAISGGEQIVRLYNPVVSNPNTAAQVAQRAKLKLMSQIAADLAPIIAIPKDGLKSSRNIFVSMNIGNATFDQNTAEIAIETLQITQGNAYLPMVEASATAGGVDVQLTERASDDITSVVYVLLKEGADQQIRIVDSMVVNSPGNDRDFVSQFHTQETSGCVLAYGIRSSVAGVEVGYGDYTAQTANDIAQLVTSRKIKNTSGSLTRTQGAVFA